MKQARPAWDFVFSVVLICNDEFPIKLTNSDKSKDLLEIKHHGLVIRLNSSKSLCLMSGDDPLLISSVPPQPALPGPSLVVALLLLRQLR